MYALLAAIAAAKYVLPPGSVNESWHDLAGIAFIIGTVCALMYIALLIVPPLVTMILFREFMFRQRQLEAHHDMANVEKLLGIDQAVLRQADIWLSAKIDRIRRRMALIFGGPEKVAIFALAGLGWLVWKEFPANLDPWVQRGLILGICFLTGAAIGSLFSQSELRYLHYQRELLSMAIGHCVARQSHVA